MAYANSSQLVLGRFPERKKICVVGAGAIGGLLAAKFALADEDVVVIDQGAHVAAIQAHGLTLEWSDGDARTVKVRAVKSTRGLGAQDLVVLAVKANVLEQVVGGLSPLIGPETIILTVQDGLPWWYFQKLGGDYDHHRLKCLDPSGLLTEKVDSNRLIGCVVHSTAVAVVPGLIHHVEGDYFPIGELDGRETSRVKDLYDTFVSAGLRSRILDDIRSEIWLKTSNSLSVDPISALAHATLPDICQLAETRDLAAEMMQEVLQVARKLGVTFPVSTSKLLAGAEAASADEPSVLQDVKAGRALETEALIGSVLEVAKLTETPTPLIECVYALVKLLNKVMMVQGGGIKFEKHNLSQYYG